MEEKKKTGRVVYEGNILDLRIDTVELPNGRETTREVVVHPGAVAVVAVTEDNDILLIRQYRYPVGKVIWEVPAGKLEKGEDPLECARRELAEETGYGAKEWRHLSTFFTTPGFSDEIMYMYLAGGLYHNPKQADEDEFIELCLMPFEEAMNKVTAGEIQDAKTIAGILLAWQHTGKRK